MYDPPNLPNYPPPQFGIFLLLLQNYCRGTSRNYTTRVNTAFTSILREGEVALVLLWAEYLRCEKKRNKSILFSILLFQQMTQHFKKYLLYSAASIGKNVQGKCHYSQHLGALFIQQLIITLETKGDDYDSSVKPQKQV